MIGMGWDEFKSIREANAMENAMRGGRGLNLYYGESVRRYDPGLEGYNSGIAVPVYVGYLGFHTSWGVELTGIHKERTRIMLELKASMDETPRAPLERKRTQGSIEDILRDIKRRLVRSYRPVSYRARYDDDTVHGTRDRVLEGLRLRSFCNSIIGGGALR